jgi:D,D-heptose 1,7-bisphosphate phosphatase
VSAAMKNKAVFLDRDGTINVDYGYVKSPDEVKIFDDVYEALKLLKSKGFLLIVVTNQSGVTRGLMTEDDVVATNEHINREIKQKIGIQIDKFYYCPYHQDFDGPEKAKCRKPSPFMVLQAQKDFNIDLNKSFFIGDTITDMQCAQNANVGGAILVKTAKDNQIVKLKNYSNLKIDFIANNFADAAKFIIEQSNQILEEN